MVRGEFGITTDFHTFTSSLSNCGKRWVWVGLFCDRTPMANTSRIAGATRRKEKIFMFPPILIIWHGAGKRYKVGKPDAIPGSTAEQVSTLRSVEKHPR